MQPSILPTPPGTGRRRTAFPPIRSTVVPLRPCSEKRRVAVPRIFFCVSRALFCMKKTPCVSRPMTEMSGRAVLTSAEAECILTGWYSCVSVSRFCDRRMKRRKYEKNGYVPDSSARLFCGRRGRARNCGGIFGSCGNICRPQTGSCSAQTRGRPAQTECRAA